jgi:hypothetical protein
MTDFSLLLAGVLLLKMLALPLVNAKCQLQPAGQLIWAECLLYRPSVVVHKDETTSSGEYQRGQGGASYCGLFSGQNSKVMLHWTCI